jgi:hypothetical protein
MLHRPPTRNRRSDSRRLVPELKAVVRALLITSLYRSEAGAEQKKSGSDHRGSALGEPKNMRPVRGDNRTGQAIWRWGGWALAPNIAYGEGITAPTPLGRGRPQARSKPVNEFFLCARRVSIPDLIGRLRPWPVWQTVGSDVRKGRRAGLAKPSACRVRLKSQLSDHSADRLARLIYVTKEDESQRAAIPNDPEGLQTRSSSIEANNLSIARADGSPRLSLRSRIAAYSSSIAAYCSASRESRAIALSTPLVSRAFKAPAAYQGNSISISLSPRSGKLFIMFICQPHSAPGCFSNSANFPRLDNRIYKVVRWRLHLPDQTSSLRRCKEGPLSFEDMITGNEAEHTLKVSSAQNLHGEPAAFAQSERWTFETARTALTTDLHG